jgi:hypothetical protein
LKGGTRLREDFQEIPHYREGGPKGLSQALELQSRHQNFTKCHVPTLRKGAHHLSGYHRDESESGCPEDTPLLSFIYDFPPPCWPCLGLPLNP